MSTLWHGRFADGPSAELMAYTASLSIDQRLFDVDITGSIVHVRGLERAGILTAAEVNEVTNALESTRHELAQGSFTFQPSDEDIHTAIERRVTEIAGASGAKLHTGRSRNDQCATDLRLWCKGAVSELDARIATLQYTLLDQAVQAGDAYLPGYTHLQRAQPITFAHHLLAHGWSLDRDRGRLHDARKRLDVSPLGAGALAGSSLPLDPEFTAHELGFAKAFDNSLDAVSDRDYVAELLFTLSLIGVHLSRIGEEFVIWTSAEFGFAKLADGYATGSSMLPNKKNPDIAELSRGKSGRLIGNLTGFLATLKGLPLSYNRDLQEDKEPLFDSVDQILLALSAVNGMIATASFEFERMAQAADAPDMVATDLAEYLVANGMPFRQAHAIVGDLVRRANNNEGTLDDLAAAHADLGPVTRELFVPGAAVRRRSTRGGAGPAPVTDQLVRFKNALEIR